MPESQHPGQNPGSTGCQQLDPASPAHSAHSVRPRENFELRVRIPGACVVTRACMVSVHLQCPHSVQCLTVLTDRVDDETVTPRQHPPTGSELLARRLRAIQYIAASIGPCGHKSIASESFVQAVPQCIPVTKVHCCITHEEDERIYQTSSKQVQKHQKILKLEGNTLSTANKWLSAKGEEQCSDVTTISFTAEGENRAIDFDITIHASAGDVIFGDTKNFR